ncbi:BRO-N domain-containing protein [Escherichia coli]|uniref:BRO-N domain-containing protein n=1 Tax=Escherichia coli TaxID=562 RepID=UPI0010C4B792|nr:BRO family protein [Escherichia coli]GDJ10394.1 phage antirepressor protein [Escherichia coli]GDJ54260.1 phage antirepressor protein [Escherichia coli]
MRKPVFYAGRTEISVIKFDDIQVRIVSINGEPWFVGADVCAALEISNVTDAVSVLDNDEVMTLALTEGHSGKRGGARSWNVVSESGFYKLIARSRKAATPGSFAHRFSNWVFREVIPSICKTGAYGVPFALLNDFSKRQAAYQQEASKRGYRLQQCKEAKEALEREERALWRKYQPDFLEGENNV